MEDFGGGQGLTKGCGAKGIIIIIIIIIIIPVVHHQRHCSSSCYCSAT
jgi:hypothetical protein